MLNHQLSPDTQAILLLCASFGNHRNDYPKPLTLKEYNQLAGELRSHQMTPADLLTAEGQSQLYSMNHSLENGRIIDLLERGMMLGLAVEKWTAQGLWILSRSDGEYPRRLKRHLKYKSPPILYGVGNVELLDKGGLAMVGSRHIDEEAVGYTQHLAETCAKQGLQVVSGGAKGVDQHSMLSGLNAGGSAIAVLSNSLAKAALDRHYRDSIREGQLTLISPFDPDAGFHVGNAMGRNKSVYALADYAVVISTSFNEGGTWAGATEALKNYQDIPVFVRTHGQIPEGNIELCKLGAKPFPEMPWNSSLVEILRDFEAQFSPGEEQMALDFGDDSRRPEISPPSAASIPPQPPLTKGGSSIPPQPLAEGSASDVEIDLTPSPSPTEQPTATSSDPKDLIYKAVLPVILQHLDEPKEHKVLAQYLNVQINQMRDWLERAKKEGKVIKLSKPTRYQIAPDSAEVD